MIAHVRTHWANKLLTLIHEKQSNLVVYLNTVHKPQRYVWSQLGFVNTVQKPQRNFWGQLGYVNTVHKPQPYVWGKLGYVNSAHKPQWNVWGQLAYINTVHKPQRKVWGQLGYGIPNRGCYVVKLKLGEGEEGWKEPDFPNEVIIYLHTLLNKNMHAYSLRCHFINKFGKT